MRPGTNLTTSTASASTTAPVNTGTWFAAGLTSQGPTGAQLVLSQQQFINVFGVRGVNPLFADCVEAYFKRGGAQLYVARVVGPSASASNVSLSDVSTGPAVKVYAVGPGSYSTGYKILITGTAGSYTIQVQDANSNVLETSPTLASNADAVGYGQTSSYVRIVSTGANSPAAGTFTLTGGSDDISNVVDTSYTNALGAFTADLGPGQVSVPGKTTTAVISALFAHGATFNRVAVADLPDQSQIANPGLTSAAISTSLQASMAPITALGTTARAGGCFFPWVDIAPIAGTLARRAIPPSPYVAAAMAQVDALGNPNVPAAGEMGKLPDVVALHATLADIDRQTVNLAGVNVICTRGNAIKIYGNVTAVNRQTDPNYYQLSNARLDMAINARSTAIAELYVLSQIDGQGIDAARYGNDLTSMLREYYDRGALFGATAADAFSVNTGPSVNTATTEAAGDLIAVLSVRRSPGAEQVDINVLRVPITQSL